MKIERFFRNCILLYVLSFLQGDVNGLWAEPVVRKACWKQEKTPQDVSCGVERVEKVA